MDIEATIANVINSIVDFVGQVFTALRDTPGGFGLIILPLGILWIIVVLVSRRR